MRNRITHIRTPDSKSDDVERITDVKGVDSEKKDFTYSVPQVIALMGKGNTFFVKVDKDEVDVIIATRLNLEYIKTKLDHTKRDNLLSLPQF